MGPKKKSRKSKKSSKQKGKKGNIYFNKIVEIAVYQKMTKPIEMEKFEADLILHSENEDISQKEREIEDFIDQISQLSLSDAQSEEYLDEEIFD
jgi:hypothetical protein